MMRRLLLLVFFLLVPLGSTDEVQAVSACHEGVQDAGQLYKCNEGAFPHRTFFPILSVALPDPNYDFGIEAYMIGNDQASMALDATRRLGFGWVNQEISWELFEQTPGDVDFFALDTIVSAANARNIRLLLTVTNAPDWARELGYDNSVDGPPRDPALYAGFVRLLAETYCGTAVQAIQVWEGQNIHYHWGNLLLDAASYMELLRQAYGAIKEECPSMMVISGALLPAGNNMPYAMDDFSYLEQMLRAGGNEYFDALGAQHSGYNVPPTVTWERACEATQKSGNLFNGACDSPHHSWSFRSTLEGYRNVMLVYHTAHKQIWVTKFGWAAGGAIDPRYRYADDNTYDEQAAWSVEAYQMMQNWEWVGPAFLSNMNGRVAFSSTPLSMWGIVGQFWEPLPVYNALRTMPK